MRCTFIPRWGANLLLGRLWFTWHIILLAGWSTTTTAAPLTVCDEAALRAALAGGGTVLFDCDGVIPLSNAITINADTTLDGNGRNVTLSGNNAVRVFYVNPGVSLTLRNLTIANGLHAGTNSLAIGAGGEPGRGGGVYNNGALTLVNCVFSNNVARGGMGSPEASIRGTYYPPGRSGDGEGGAIYSRGGSLRATNGTFIANSSVGGVSQTAGGQPVRGDAGDALGGGVFAAETAFVFANAAFALNQSHGGTNGPGFTGGGIFGSAFGGAFAAVGSTGIIAHATFNSNRASGASVALNLFPRTGAPGSAAGGAVWATNSEVVLMNGRAVDNTAIGGSGPRAWGGRAEGGAVFSVGAFSISESHFSGNRTLGAYGYPVSGDANGGAIMNNGSFSIDASTLSDNAAVAGAAGSAGFSSGTSGHSSGGAIFNGGQLFVTNCTVRGNLARGGTGAGPFLPPHGLGMGGGIANANSMMVLNTTLVANRAETGAFTLTPGQGGGIFSTNGTSALRNTIVANHVVGSNAFGSLLDQGYNLSSDASCAFTSPGSLNNTDPLLSPLADFGGPTWTMALLQGSPAIDAAPTTNCPPTDQRGRIRPYGPGCDIGAFESSAPFSIRGRVIGYRPVEGITVSASTSTTTNKSDRTYILFGVAPGPNTVTPSSPDAVSIPNSRSLDVTADILGVDFKSYRFNGLTVDSYSNSIVNLVYAGTVGQVQETQRTPNFATWSPFSTNTVGSEGIFRLQVSNAPAAGLEFFRTRRVQ